MGTMHLPDYVHQHIMEIKDTWGKAKAFRDKAKLSHDNFNRIVDKGCGRPTVILRVIAAYEEDKQPVEITGDKVKQVVQRFNENIVTVVTSATKMDAFMKQLCGWILYKRDFSRRQVKEALGYGSESWVTMAVENIENEIDVNKDFKKLTFRLLAEL